VSKILASVFISLEGASSFFLYFFCVPAGLKFFILMKYRYDIAQYYGHGGKNSFEMRSYFFSKFFFLVCKSLFLFVTKTVSIIQKFCIMLTVSREEMNV